MVVGRLMRVNRFPVKSMQGERLEEAEVTADGVYGDRIYALRDLETGKVASAKKPQWFRPLLDCSATIVDGAVHVRLPDGTQSVAGEPEADELLSRYLGRPVRFDRAVSQQQGVYASEWPEIEGLTLSGDMDFPVAMMTAAASHVDLAALHLMTTSTLRQLRSLAPDSEMDERRFRPNLLIETDGDGFLEDDWQAQTLRIGDTLEITLGAATPRCVMTTVEQPGLAADREILKVVAQHNRHTYEGVGTYACAGVYGEVAVPGTVRLGDDVVLVG